MAEDVETPEEGEEPPKSKKKLIILILLALLLVGGVGAGTLFFLSSNSESEEATAEEVVVEDIEDAIYFPIRPPIIVNFNARGKRHLLQISLTVLTRDPQVVDALQLHLPLIKNDMSLIISGEVYQELQTDEGREVLRKRLADRLNLILQREMEAETSGVEQVLYENFVLQ